MKFILKVIVGTIVVIGVLLFGIASCTVGVVNEVDKEVNKAAEDMSETEVKEEVVEAVGFEFKESNEEWSYTYLNVTINNDTDKTFDVLDYKIYVELKNGSKVKFYTYDEILPDGKTVIEIYASSYYVEDEISSVSIVEN